MSPNCRGTNLLLDERLDEVVDVELGRLDKRRVEMRGEKVRHVADGHDGQRPAKSINRRNERVQFGDGTLGDLDLAAQVLDVVDRVRDAPEEVRASHERRIRRLRARVRAFSGEQTHDFLLLERRVDGVLGRVRTRDANRRRRRRHLEDVRRLAAGRDARHFRRTSELSVRVFRRATIPTTAATHTANLKYYRVQSEQQRTQYVCISTVTHLICINAVRTYRVLRHVRRTIFTKAKSKISPAEFAKILRLQNFITE